jgi:PAS domain S-box-containing protein
MAAAMRHAPIGMAIVGPDGSFLEANPALCAMLGRSEAELLSATWQELTHADDVAVDTGLVAEVLAGDRDTYRLSKRYLRPDGEVVEGDLSVSCVRRADGQVDYFVSQIVDVTEQKQLEARYRLLAENGSDVVALGNNAGEIVWVSPSITTTLGWAPEELVGHPFRGLVHPDDQPLLADIQHRLLEGHRGRLEIRVRTVADGYRWTSISIRPVLDDAGEIVGRVSSWWDAEEAHLARELLDQVRERYRAALDAELDAHVFLDAVRSEDGRIEDFVYVDANAQACTYVGRSMDELVGVRMLHAYPGQRASGLFDHYVELVESGRPLVLDEVAIDSEVAHATRWFDFRGVKVGDGLSLTWRDVSDRVQARTALEESEEHYRLLAENASDVVFQGSPEAIIQWVSPSVAEVLGGRVEDYVGQHVSTLLHPDDAAAMQRASSGVNAGDRVSYRARARVPVGERWVEITARPVRDAAGQVIARVGSVRDVHEQVLAEEALERSERAARELAARFEVARNEALEANLAKTVFQSRMSHELRTPLNSILGFGQLMELGVLDEDEQRDALQTMRRAGQHLLRMIDEILDISRIEAGRLSLSMESVVVGDAVREAIDIASRQAEQAGITLALVPGECADDRVWADRQRTIQILLNLVTNAIKYNQPGGSVVVTCASDGDNRVRIGVRDTGPGLDEQQQARLFEPFDRLGAETSGIEGTGIGLTLSAALASAMSGRIEVDSVPGEGSTFSLVLPRSTVASPLAGSEPVIVGADPQRETAVLYIEDNPANTTLMSRIAGLRDKVQLRIETTGGAGLAAAVSDPPDLVLLDLHLPDISGQDVLQSLRADPRTAQVPVVIVTADASRDVVRRLRHLGADALLTKPVDVTDVLSWLDNPRRARGEVT